jgi:ElaB/YqjD/DUF883 family membrane-anchored ribosome-binding protein
MLNSSLKDQMQEAASSVTEGVQQASQNTKKVLSNTYDHLQKDVKDYAQKGQEKFLEVEKKVEGQIKRYPFSALLIAAGVGFGICLLRKKK